MYKSHVQVVVHGKTNDNSLKNHLRLYIRVTLA